MVFIEILGIVLFLVVCLISLIFIVVYLKSHAHHRSIIQTRSPIFESSIISTIPIDHLKWETNERISIDQTIDLFIDKTNRTICQHRSDTEFNGKFQSQISFYPVNHRHRKTLISIKVIHYQWVTQRLVSKNWSNDSNIKHKNPMRKNWWKKNRLIKTKKSSSNPF